jgi:D-psicose/D-tagatose/L-ribulose 3-epimerase
MAVRHAIGANAWIWVSPLTDDGIETLAPRLREWGFDVLELPLEAPGDWDPGRTAECLAEAGLEATICVAMTPERDLTTTDREVVAATQDYLRLAVEAAARIGAATVAGPIYAPVGRTWRMAPGERTAVLERLVANLRPVADHAAEHGVRLGIEPLNRFETSVLNTVDQALEVVSRIDSPACGLLLDTFHMNIEEKDPQAAVRAAAGRIVHVHVCGNDRGAPGADHIDWPGTLAAVADTGYDGPLVIESFTGENQAIATAASIWRRLAPTQDEIAVDGLAFLRRLMPA